MQAYAAKQKSAEETKKASQRYFEPNQEPQHVYSDNSKEIKKACESLGYTHDTSTPHRSETNGIAERAVRRVKEGTASVLTLMLRRICGVTRHGTEEWVPWIQRVTHKARQLALDAGVRDWARAHAIRKWSWAGHAARRSADSWLWRVTFWRDSEWNEVALEMGSHRPLRPSRRRWMKWEEPLRRFMAAGPGGSWSTAAQDRETWEALTEEFASWFVHSDN